MKKYEVVINRIGYSSHIFEVEAKSKKEAEEKGLQEAYNTSFSEHDSEYEIEGVLFLKEENENTNTRR